MPIGSDKKAWRWYIVLAVCMALLFSGCEQKKHHVDLRWDAPKNSPIAVAGYNIYRSIGEQYAYHRLNSSPVRTTTFEDDLAQSGRTYIYVVRSVSASGIESGPSNVARVTIP